MKKNHVSGENRGEIFIYALSTCAWCRKMKSWLENASLEYSYVDVDRLSDEEKQEVIEELKKWNPRCSYPTVVVNRSECFVGYKPDRLKELISP